MWNIEDVSVGDYLSVQTINKKGDRNLDGMITSGKVKDVVSSHRMARLESEWCCHEKDRLLKHIKVGK